MSLISNNVDFGIVSDSEIVSIISNFSDDMIMDIIHRNSANKFRPYQHYVGNLVGAIESSFKANAENYPQFYAETMERRNEAYSNIFYESVNHCKTEFQPQHFPSPNISLAIFSREIEKMRAIKQLY